MSKKKLNNRVVFSFGENWKNFITKLDEEKIENAQNSLSDMLCRDDLHGLRFLDAGCGSGLLSLSAIRLEATEVVSFDADQDCVECARHLNNRYGPYSHWKVLSGNVLDRDWLDSLGKFDIIYSWGVLHHTGAMWKALENIILPVSDEGTLYISIYNDQGIISKFWEVIKKFYNIFPKPMKFLMATGYFVFTFVAVIILGIIKRRPPSQWFEDVGERGMNLWHDIVDWIGGYPFETAKPEEIEHFFMNRGFKIVQSKIKSGSGCNEFVFTRSNGDEKR